MGLDTFLGVFVFLKLLRCPGSMLSLSFSDVRFVLAKFGAVSFDFDLRFENDNILPSDFLLECPEVEIPVSC